MKNLRLSVLLLSVCFLLLLHADLAAAQEVKIENVTFQQVLDRLFGTTGNPGLLEGNKRFELHAEHVTLTGDQARTFFVPTTTNTSDIADLIAAAQQARGELKIEGLLDGSPFEFKLAGREIKLEGLDLTRAQLDSLVDQLKGISGLREAKIESMVDGHLVEVKLENRAERVKVDGEKEIEEHHSAETSKRGSGNIERRDKMERPEKVEKVEKVERVEKIERVERPESRSGPGRP